MTTATAEARRTRRPWLRRLVGTLVVLAVLAAVLDRGGDYAAERLAADHLRSSQRLDSQPDVSIDGVPFLTQFAQGHYDHIAVDVHDLPVANGAVRISHLHVDLNQVTVSHDFATFHVTSATAAATITYADLSSRLGVDVSYAGHDRIAARKTFDLPGVGTVSPTISVRPVLADGALSFGASSINGAGDSLGLVSDALNKIFDLSIPLDGVPFGVTIRSLTADTQGLQAHLVGADLTFRPND